MRNACLQRRPVHLYDGTYCKLIILHRAFKNSIQLRYACVHSGMHYARILAYGTERHIAIQLYSGHGALPVDKRAQVVMNSSLEKLPKHPN